MNKSQHKHIITLLYIYVFYRKQMYTFRENSSENIQYFYLFIYFLHGIIRSA